MALFPVNKKLSFVLVIIPDIQSYIINSNSEISSFNRNN